MYFLIQPVPRTAEPISKIKLLKGGTSQKESELKRAENLPTGVKPCIRKRKFQDLRAYINPVGELPLGGTGPKGSGPPEVI